MKSLKTYCMALIYITGQNFREKLFLTFSFKYLPVPSVYIHDTAYSGIHLPGVGPLHS